MKCELKVIRYAGREWFNIGSWRGLLVRIVRLCLITTIAIPLTLFCKVQPINTLYVGCILGAMMYLLAWGRCREGGIK